jgi:hypothetical protein
MSTQTLVRLQRMKLLAIKGAASAKSDTLRFVRADGSASEIDMPRQGVLAHDLVHYVVESGLGLGDGFLSLVAAGADARFVMALTHDVGRAQVERGAVQAEAIVEALQTQLWSGAFDVEAFAYGVRMAAEARGIEPPGLPGPERCAALFEHARRLHAHWVALAPFGQMALVFAPGRAIPLEVSA